MKKNKLSFQEKIDMINYAKSIIDPNEDWAELYFPDDDVPIIINQEIMIKDIKTK